MDGRVSKEAGMKETRGSVLARVAGSLVYLGLAVWGRGAFAAFFDASVKFGRFQAAKRCSSPRLASLFRTALAP
jgi:hypothetical protein